MCNAGGKHIYYIIGERERANLVVRLARFFYIYVYTCIYMCLYAAGVTHTVIFLNVFT